MPTNATPMTAAEHAATASRLLTNLDDDDDTRNVVMLTVTAQRLADEAEGLGRLIDTDPVYADLRERASRVLCLALAVSETLDELQRFPRLSRG